MVLVPIQEQFEVMLLCLQKDGVTLFGFLLYTICDQMFIDYMKVGMCELDFLSGDQCAIFVIESPSKQWVNYTKKNDHFWWRKYGQTTSESSSGESEKSRQRKVSLLAQSIIRDNQGCIIVIGDDNKASFQQIIAPEYNLPFDPTEALKIASRFGLTSKDIPCLVFFKNLNSSNIWSCTLGHLRDKTDVKNFFRNFFDSSMFKSLLNNEKEL